MSQTLSSGRSSSDIRQRDDANASVESLEDLTSAVGAADLFVFRRMSGARFIHLGGAGRGADWAGVIEADLDDETIYAELGDGEVVWRQYEQPQHIFGPYHASTFVMIRPAYDIIVVFGTNIAGPLGELPPEEDVLEIAREAAELVDAVSPTKRLADQLEVLHAVRELTHTDRDDADVDDVLANLTRVAANALSCELCVVWMPDGRHHIHAAGRSAPEDGERLDTNFRQIWANRTALPQCYQDAAQSPLPYPLDADSGVVSTYLMTVGSPPIALLVLAHTKTDPRGFTDLCQEVATQLVATADVLLATALSREHLLQTVARESRANEELSRVNGELALGALHDPLTGLPNRVMLQQHTQRLREKGVEAREPGAELVAPALLYVDLDGFKAVNDEWGHAVGDAVLVEFGSRLRGSCRPGDVPARLAGDEFALLLADPVTSEEALAVANRIVATASVPFLIDDAAITIGASVGVAAFTGVADFDSTQSVLDGLLRRSDLAMYRAKTRGRGRAELFTQRTCASVMAANRRVGDDPAMTRKLRAALDEEKLVLNYQPFVDLSSGQVLQVEALARWPQDDGSAIPPDEFIGLAERTGLICQLGEWALRTACAQAATWDERRLPEQSVSVIAVNVSAAQLNDPDFFDLVVAVLAENTLEPHRLCLEITERGITMHEDLQSATIRSLSELGVLIALDDFGTGRSSLTLMSQLPLNWVKIDGDFIARVDVDPAKAISVRLVIESAHALNLRVCAEQVERHAQLAQLATMGCGVVQGRLLGGDTTAELLDTGVRTVRDLITSESVRPMLSGRGQLLCLIDATGAITYISAESVSMLGYQPMELAGTQALDLVSPIDRRRSELALKRTESDEVIVRHSLLRRDGAVVWVEAIHQLVRDPGTGDLRHIITTAMDITDRVFAEGQLAEQSLQLRGAVDSAPYGVAVLSDDWVLTQVNPALTQFLGCSEEQLLGQDMQSFAHYDDVAEIVHHVRDRSHGEALGHTMRIRLVHADGHPLLADLTVVAIGTGSGASTYIVAHIRPLGLTVPRRALRRPGCHHRA